MTYICICGMVGCVGGCSWRRQPAQPLWTVPYPVAAMTPEVYRAVLEEGAAIAAGIIALGEWARRCGESWEEAEMLRHLSGDPYEGIYGDGRGGGR